MSAARDEAIRHLRATTSDLRTARGGMIVIRNQTLPGTVLYRQMSTAILYVDDALVAVERALDDLAAMQEAA